MKARIIFYVRKLGGRSIIKVVNRKEDLLRLLAPHFKNVKVFETIYPTRHNLYFFASEYAALPFDANWTHQVVKA